MTENKKAIAELEVRLTHQQETVDTLNDVVTRQWTEIDRLKSLCEALKQRLLRMEESSRDGGNVPPPHY